MCFSAMVWQDVRTYERRFGATVDTGQFRDLYAARGDGAKIKIPKGMDAAFAEPRNALEEEIHELIVAHDAEQTAAIEQEIFQQKKRLAEAERTLQSKETKKAIADQRIATDKIARGVARLADLRRTEPKSRDSRIFPNVYAPVLVSEGGRRVVKPMRYGCRPAGRPAFYDRKYPGTYNARRDNLEGFWKGQFGRTHGLVVATAFFENVSLHAAEGRELRPDEKEQNVVLEFRPSPEQEMLVACLWSHWTGKDQADLLSFAAITDEPPAEVAAAGHDRCIIPIDDSNVDAWLDPSRADLATQYGILDDRERPYYEHRKAA